MPSIGRVTMTSLMLLSLLLAACNGEEAGTEDASETETTTTEVEVDGPLVSTEAGVVGFQDFSQGTEKSFGIFVCVTDEDVVLESVEAMSSEGDIEVIGATLYVADDAFVGAINDFPPRGLSEAFLSDIPGAVVMTGCESGSDRSQVIVGASRTGTAGGIIEGIRINYEGGSLEVSEYNIVLCGDEGEYCENVNSSADPGSAGAHDEL
jgi:hypothetical protein